MEPPPPPLAPPPSLAASQKQPPSRRFSTGEVLGETFAIFFSSAVPLVITALIIGPFSLLSHFVAWSVGGPAGRRIEELLDLIQSFGVAPLATAAIIYAVFQRMRGRQVEMGDAIRVGFSKLGRVVGVAILQSLGIVVGTFLFIIPGIVFATMLAVAVPVAVEETEVASSALSRSTKLTEGHRWSIFFVYVCLIVLGVAAAFVLSFLVVIVTGGNKFAFKLASIPLVIVANGVSATASTVMYYRLRSVKESLDVDQIASVFD